MTNWQRQSPLELMIGVVGPHELVEQIMLSGAAPSQNGTVATLAWPGPAHTPPGTDMPRRLIGAAHRNEQEAAEVGVGLGRTAQEAEAHARAALTRSHTGQGPRGFAVDREGHALVPGPRAPAVMPVANPKGMTTLARLAGKLPGGDAAQAVDAETAGRMLGVTARTARRLLHTLVEEGLAWPLPPSRAPQPGRPRQFYRLVTEKLERHPPS